MRLDKLQSDFAKHLLHESVDIDALNIGGPFPPEQLLSLYRNNFYISFREYLTACFPSVSALVGDAFFEQLTKAFTKDKPLESGSIEYYGEQFANYIETCEQTQELGYLSDIARFDWAVDRAKSIIEFSEFPFAELSELTEQQQLAATFILQDNTLLIDSAFPVFDIWQGVQTGNLEGVDMQESQQVVICPSAEHGVQYQVLNSSQFDFLAAVAEGVALQQLAALDDFQQHLQYFISVGFINNFLLQGEI